MTALVRPIVAVDAQNVIPETQSKAERVDDALCDLLADKVMDEKRLGPVLVSIMASDYSEPIDVLQVAFNVYAAHVERKTELPRANTNLLKLLADQELQIWRRRERVHTPL